MKIIFAGTPLFAARHLDALIKSPHEICAVYTQPDRPAGRGKKPQASAVKHLAETHHLKVYQPSNFKHEKDQALLATHQADLMIVVAYGLLLPKVILDTPRLGCINVHGSILPRWRGAAPIQRAIENGDTHSGVTIMQMDVGLDTGAMLQKILCDIDATESSASLHDKLAELGPPLLLSVLDTLEQGSINPEHQDDTLSNYAKKIDKHEACIDWHEGAEIIDRKIRAFNPFPICFSFLNGQRIKIHRAHPASAPKPLHAGELLVQDSTLYVGCGNGSLIVDTLQAPGKKATSAHDFINGSKHLFDSPETLTFRPEPPSS